MPVNLINGLVLLMSDVEKSISEWLEKSGYPLELYALQRLLARGYFCTKSDLYKDAVTKVAREIDLIGDLSADSDGPDAYQLKLLIECKKSDKPCIILSDNHRPNDRLSNILGQQNDYDQAMRVGVNLFFNLAKCIEDDLDDSLRVFKGKTPAGYSLVKAFSNSDADIYNGILGLAAAEDYYIANYKSLFDTVSNQPAGELLYLLFFPILLVDAPLYYAYLGDQGSTVIEPTYWGTIHVRKPWGIEKEQITCIQVVQKEHFDQVLVHLEALFRHAIKRNVLYGSY